MELLMGCGSSRERRMGDGEWTSLVRLDFDASHKPDVVADLRQHPLPFADNTFDEIHAYEVLEHLAPQGDYEFFFAEWTEYHRIMKPGGMFFGSCPWWQGKWAWGDPGHTRVIQPETLNYLAQSHYNQVGTTMSSDYRFCYKVDWKPELMHHVTPEGEPFEGQFYFALRAV